MHLRKSWFGYLWFAFGTLLIGTYLYKQFFSLFGELINNNWGHVDFAGIDLSYVLAACLLIVCFGLFFLVSFLKKAVPSLDERVSSLLKCIFFVVLFAAFLFYGCFSRYQLISEFWKSGERLGFASSFADSVMNVNSPENSGCISLLFYKIIKIFLEIFGEKQIVIGYVNAIMFIVAAMFTCFAVYYGFNGFCALAVFGYLMCMPSSPLSLFDGYGKNFWFLLVSLFVFIAAYFLDAFKDKYEEVSYFLLLIIVLSVLIFNHFLYIPFELKNGINSSLFDFSFSNNIVVTGIVTIFALFGCLSFLKLEKDETSIANIFLTSLTVLLLLDFSSNELKFPVAVFVFILAGFGFKNFFFEGYKVFEIVPDNEMIEDNNEIPKEEKSTEDIKEEATVKVEKVIIEQTAKEDSNDGLEKIDIPKPSKPRFIENPLPVPKKHVKKNIEYAFEPSSDQMEYDIFIDETDDFDIK